MDDKNIKVTRHAEKRIRQRLGVNKKSTERTAEKALQQGITHKEATGKLSKYMDGIFLANRTLNNMRVYNHSIYLFHGKTLITVLPLPKKYWNCADKIKRKKSILEESEADATESPEEGG